MTATDTAADKNPPLLPLPQDRPRREDFRCLHRLEVRWAEVDAQKIVFNAHYLMYADVAITAYWRALALPYDAAMAALGGELYVKKASLEYHGSAEMGDVLDIGIRCVRLGNSSLQFVGGIFRGTQLLNTVDLLYVFADPATQTSKPIAPELRAMLQQYEAGLNMVRLESGDWSRLGRDAQRLRMAVFVREQGVSAELEIDGRDPAARHVVLYNGAGMGVATGRLITQSPGVGRIGRMAVDRSLRGGQYGRKVLDALVEAARLRGDRQVQLHAQCSAEGFYRRAGFTVLGEPYDEAGIAHITMVRDL